GVVHTFVGGATRVHNWGSGWLDGAIQGLANTSNSTPRHDENARRIVAYGFRDPSRFTLRPGTNDLWVGDVGWNTWEELDRVSNPTTGVATNYGWPAYEGPNRQPSYDNQNLPLLEALYADGPSAVAAPYYSYQHSQQVVAGSGEPTGNSSVSGMAFGVGNGNLPWAFDGALFFADYARDSIYVMYRGVNYLPDVANRTMFVTGARNPFD